ERSNHVEFSNFDGNSGMSIDLSSGDPTLQALGLGPKQLIGTTLFPNTFHRRTVPVDRNNWGPRLGFAYQLGQNTVLRGGAGVYYGMNVATNFNIRVRRSVRARPCFSQTITSTPVRPPCPIHFMVA